MNKKKKTTTATHTRVYGQWHTIQCESKQVAPLKLFAIFSLRLIIFREILPVCCQFISTHTYQFCLIYLNMALIFLGALIIFTAVSVHMILSDEDKIWIQNLYHLDGYKATYVNE